MPSLKALRTRINSVKSTRKITQAMKMVAASKLKRAQSQAEQARPYAERMERMLGALAASVAGSPIAPPMLVGTGKEDVHLLVVVSADRGLCGGFNTAVSRFARNRTRALIEQGKTVKILTVGRKGRDFLRREYRKNIVGSIDFVGRKQIGFEDAVEIANQVTEMLEGQQFDVCTLIYNRFKNVITQVPSEQRLIPASIEGAPTETAGGPRAAYEYEPGEEEILAELLPRNLAIQIYRALLESAAGEQGARMTAMDNATRNAGDMIARLTLNYNRQRQANITKELIEIISGAEAI
ncbi:F0F1 ATP synthase subunit gamma [Elioraea tepidiphila]|jgi:F-type H+-transporting ATPase subunit gamma|uniref:F0F1 ATP synthase subunit gamma n=1 Tax=Elioraea tepidiphila TaxID=457934 RepID=UPI00036476B4|nr:F0F1 ATP synthase subunit gamma [Elioraea tepidiphila]